LPDTEGRMFHIHVILGSERYRLFQFEASPSGELAGWHQAVSGRASSTHRTAHRIMSNPLVRFPKGRLRGRDALQRTSCRVDADLLCLEGSLPSRGMTRMTLQAKCPAYFADFY
jgi:hypothetical protein